MGLDITAYERVELIDRNVAEADYDREDGAVLHPNDSFPGRADGLVRGFYRVYGKPLRFRAGSYSGYNQWREELAKLAGYPLTEYDGHRGAEQRHAAACWGEDGMTGPFSELINFADNEGIIGPNTAEKLARDFDEWEQRALAFDGGEWDVHWFEAYRRWQSAFHMAAKGGCVVFH